MEYTLILLAAGRGTRTGLDYNKVFYVLPDGKSVLQHSLDLFEADPDCRKIVLVSAPDELEEVRSVYEKGKVVCTPGGQTRQDSVWNGLQKVETPYVMIHDAARPFVQAGRIADIKTALETWDACLLAAPSVDTIKIADALGNVAQTPDRALVWNAQTPQAFRTDVIRKAHQTARDCGFLGTDDCSLVEVFTEIPVRIVPGDSTNKKITNPEDVRLEADQRPS